MKRSHNENQSRQSGPSERSRPLREFSHGSGKSVVSVRKHRIKIINYWALPLLVFIVILGCGGYFALNFNTREVASEEPQSRPAFSASAEDIEVRELMEAYLDAIGGRDALRRVRSVRYEGSVYFESGESDFQMLLLLPDKGMLVTNPGEATSQKLMLNGDVAWQVVEKRDGSRVITALDESATESLQWSLRVHNTLRRMALEGPFSGFSVREIEYEGEPSYELTKTAPNGSNFLAILDRETLYPLRMKETLSGEEGADKFTVNYDDYRMVSGVLEPHVTELFRNGELDNRVEIDSVRINAGVMSSLFEVPDKIRED